MKRFCSAEGCKAPIKHQNRSGLCMTHLNEKRGGHLPRCRICNDRLPSSNKSGECQWHNTAPRIAKSCAHCSEPLEHKNKSGYCARHFHPKMRVPFGRLPEYDYLVRAKGILPHEALKLLEEGPVLIPPPVNCKPILPSEIISMVAAELRTSPELIKSKSRYSQDIAARSCVVQIFRARGMSYPDIGNRLGGRDHSTIINSYHQFNTYVARYPALRRVVEKVLERAA